MLFKSYQFAIAIFAFFTHHSLQNCVRQSRKNSRLHSHTFTSAYSPHHRTIYGFGIVSILVLFPPSLHRCTQTTRCKRIRINHFFPFFSHSNNNNYFKNKKPIDLLSFHSIGMIPLQNGYRSIVALFPQSSTLYGKKKSKEKYADLFFSDKKSPHDY